MKLQIAKIIFLTALSIMKKILDLAEFKLGKQSDEYKYYKSQVMLAFYSGLQDLFKTLKDNKIVENCPCKADLKQGYASCSNCGGSGYKNTEN